MPKELLNSIVQNTVRLSAFAVFAAIILSTAFALTDTRITDQRLNAERQALNIILPPDQHDNDLISDSYLIDINTNEFRHLELLGLRENTSAYIARKDSQPSGLILPMVARDGYNGDIHLLVGISIDGSVTGLRVTSHRETPGLGDLIDLRISDWILSFNNRSLTNLDISGWTVRKNGGILISSLVPL